jgi:microcystin-dependent protein
MAYQVNFTDTINNPEPIVVNDNTVNTTTDLKFPGRNSTGYGQDIAENFLHLLENFANTSPPERPIIGQLWFDSNAGVNQLKVNVDGTPNGWSSAGGLKRGSTEPDTAASISGDLWVNTSTQQLYLFTGSTWILVGPEFGQGARSGSIPEVVPDTTGVNRLVVSIYVEGDRVAIVSKNAFTPKAAISGFGNGVKAGVNLNSNYNTYWGTAEKASALIVGTTVVEASNFLRSDAVSNTFFPLNVKNATGVSVGEDSQVTLGLDGTSGVFSNKTAGASLVLKINNNGSIKSVLTVDSRERVGINKVAPETELDIIGSAQLTGTLEVNSIEESLSPTTGALTVAGGVGIGGDLNIAGEMSVDRDFIVSTAILPDTPLGANLGDINRQFNRVFASRFDGSFYGSLVGSVTGNVSGSSSKLASATAFSLTGDVTSDVVNFDGQFVGPGETSGVKIFNTVLSETFIAEKPEVNAIAENDEFVVSRGTEGLKKIKKSSIWQSISRNPIGSVTAYAGVLAPQGWLLCDGSEVLASDYPELFSVIGYTYGDPTILIGSGTFKLPDLRGRFALGLDNMNNGVTVPSKLDPRVQVQSGGGSANRVNDIEADNIGLGAGASTKNINIENLPDHEHDMRGNAGNQYYAFRNISGTPPDTDAISGQGSLTDGLGQYLATSGGVLTNGSLGVAMNIMNPYMSLNYIIYTGRDI